MARSMDHFPFDSGTPFGGVRSSLGLTLVLFGTGSLIRFIAVGAGA